MKTILTLFFLSLFYGATAQTNLLTGNIESFGQSGRTNVTMALTLISPKNQTTTTNFVSNDNLQTVSDTNGNFSFSNVLAGVYFLNAGDSSSTRYRIPVYTNTLGLVSLASLANAGGTPPNPNTNFVSQAQLTAALAGVSGGGGSATNALINGPGGIRDASLITNVQGSALVGPITNSTSGNSTTATTAVNLSGSITSSQVTGSFASNQITSINGSQVQGNVAGAVNATNVTGSVNATQLTGTVANNLLSINVATNDPSAALFYKNSGVNDQFAQADLNYGIAAEKQYGAWSSLIQASCLLNRYNAFTNVPLVGNAWVPTNVVWGLVGGRLNSSNVFTVPLPTLVSNFSVTICYRMDVNCFNVEGNSSCSALLSLYNVTNNSSVVLTEPSYTEAQKVDSSVGNSFYSGQTVGTATSNMIYMARSGVWAASERQMPMHISCLTVSYNTNGQISTWYNGNPNVFNNLAITNLLTEQALTTTNFTTLAIGSGGSAWNLLGGAPLTQNGYEVRAHTNAAGMEVYWVILHNQSVEQNTNIPIADKNLCFASFGKRVVTVFGGDSVIWFPADQINYPNQLIPITNTMSLIYEQMHPSELVLNDAYPGSYLQNYANMGGTYGNRYSYVPSFAYLSTSQFTTIQIKSDAGDNDAALGVVNSINLANWYNFFIPYSSNGCSIKYINRWPVGGTGGGLGASSLQNAAIDYFYQTLKGSFPLAGTYDEWQWVTIPLLKLVAIDQTHLAGTNTIAGYNAAVSFALSVSDTYTAQPYAFKPSVYQIDSAGTNQGTNFEGFGTLQYLVRRTNGVDLMTSDGSDLTNLNASALASGVVPLPQLPVTLLSNNVQQILYTNTTTTVYTTNGSIVTAWIGTNNFVGGGGGSGGNVYSNTTSYFNRLYLGNTGSTSLTVADTNGIQFGQPAFSLASSSVDFQAMANGAFSLQGAVGTISEDAAGDITLQTPFGQNQFKANGTNAMQGTVTLPSGATIYGSGFGLTNQGFARTITSTNELWTATVQADGNTNWSSVITNVPAAQLTGIIPLPQIPAAVLTNSGANAYALSSVNVTNVMNGNTVTDTNLAIGVPSGAAAGWVFTLTNTTTGQGTWSNAPAGGGGANAAITNTSVQFTGLTVTNGQLSVSNNIPVGASFVQNSNTFAQPLVVQNLSSGGSASGEISVRADNGSSTNAFVSMGINSSGFTNGTLAPIGTNMAFFIVYGNSTNVANASNTAALMIATAQTNSSVNMSVGNGIAQTNWQLNAAGETLSIGQYNGNGLGITNLSTTNLVGTIQGTIIGALTGSGAIVLSNSPVLSSATIMRVFSVQPTNMLLSNLGNTNVAVFPTLPNGGGAMYSFTMSCSITNFTTPGIITNIQSAIGLSGLFFTTNIFTVTALGNQFNFPSIETITNNSPLTNAFYSSPGASFSGFLKWSALGAGGNP